MTAPTKECRPCPKCGQSILRSTENPARCGYCKTVKLRARLAFVVRCQDCSQRSAGKPVSFVAQPWTSKAEAKRWQRDHGHDRRGEHALPATSADRYWLDVFCDCGWQHTGSVVWVSLEEQVRYHKHQEHTP